jgi:mannose-6-phosphate isomerase-like protein (cupin superfamily)
VGPSVEGRSIQILHERYAPGADTGKVSLHHEGEEGGVVIRGELELTVDGERYVLKPGDAYYFKSSRPHRVRNIGTEECEIVSACSPPSV